MGGEDAEGVLADGYTRDLDIACGGADHDGGAGIETNATGQRSGAKQCSVVVLSTVSARPFPPLAR